VPAKSLLVIEDDARLHAPLKVVLGTGGWSARIAKTAAEGLALARAQRPQLVLLDLGLPDLDGVEVIPQLQAMYPDLPVVVLTAATSESRILAAFRAGACGYLFKDDVGERLLVALEEALSGGAPMSRRVASLVLQQLRDSSIPLPAGDAKSPTLSSRELAVVEQLAHGLTYEQVAVALRVSVNTVRSHVRSIYEKLAVGSRTEAVLVALRLGLVTGPRR
jgi:DNA-binding NarL/FixJ family response regulator